MIFIIIIGLLVILIVWYLIGVYYDRHYKRRHGCSPEDDERGVAKWIWIVILVYVAAVRWFAPIFGDWLDRESKTNGFGGPRKWPPLDTDWSDMPQKENVSREEIVAKWRKEYDSDAEEREEKDTGNH